MPEFPFEQLVAFATPVAEAVATAVRQFGLTDAQIAEVAVYAACQLSLNAHGTDVTEKVRDAVDQWEDRVIFKGGKRDGPPNGEA